MFTKLFKLIPKSETKTISGAIISLFRYNGSYTGHDMKPGSRVCISREISVKDVESFSKLTQDFNPVHSDIVHGAFLNGIVSGVIGTKLPGPGTIVISQKLEFPNPCYIGDTISVTVEISEVRKIITCNFECVTEKENKVVLKGSARLMLQRVKNSIDSI